MSIPKDLPPVIHAVEDKVDPPVFTTVVLVRNLGEEDESETEIVISERELTKIKVNLAMLEKFFDNNED